MPAEKTAATGNTNSVDKYSLLPLIPVASYGPFSATVSGFATPKVTYSWTTTAETNVAKFKIFRKNIATSVVVTFYKNAETTGLPRSYSFEDNTVANGTTYEYSIYAESSDGSIGSPSDGTSVTILDIAR